MGACNICLRHVLCVDMCDVSCVDMCVGMCANICVGICAGMLVDMQMGHVGNRLLRPFSLC